MIHDISTKREDAPWVKAQRKGFRKPCSLFQEKDIFVSIKVNCRINITRVNKFFCTCIIRCKANGATIKTDFLTHDKLCIGRTIDTTPFFLQDFEDCWIRCSFYSKEFFKTWIPRKGCINCTRCFTNTFFIVKMERCWKFCSDLFKFISRNKRCFCHLILHFFTIVILL